MLSSRNLKIGMGLGLVLRCLHWFTHRQATWTRLRCQHSIRTGP